MPIRNRLAEMQDEIAGWRRHLHTIPELLYDLPKTTAFVEERLREMDLDEITTGIGQSGIVAVIKGKTDTSGRVIGLRADMDALPINEATGVDHVSTHPGKMHACGHDGHTAILLGAAKYLSETRSFDGTVVLIFQPAEEGGAGGRAMCQDDMMARWGIDEVYGLHNMPNLPEGEFAIRPGPLLASSDFFDITVTGRGGHAAAPHMAIDSNLAAAHVLVALQSIAARNVDPLHQLVVSVCTLRSDTESYNVLPHAVQLKGTVRTLDPDVRDMAERRVREVAEATARAYDCTAEVDYQRSYPITMNWPENTDFAAEAAEAVSGVDRATPPVMAGEDFSFMLEERPGAYIFLGNGPGAHVHHPEYDFNDAVIPAGCSWFAEIVERRMPAA